MQTSFFHQPDGQALRHDAINSMNFLVPVAVFAGSIDIRLPGVKLPAAGAGIADAEVDGISEGTGSS